MSSRSTPDGILKDRYLYLSAKCPGSRLRKLGWFDFRNHDRPDTIDPIAMASAAFLHLSLSGEGNWNEATDVLTAVLAYLDAATGYTATENHLTKLAILLSEQPVRSRSIQDWFDQTFR